MLNQKELIILEMFFKNTSEYLTSKEIANNMGLSDKTIRKYLNELDDSIDDNLAKVESVRGHGYKLIICNDKEFRKFYQQNNKLIKSNRSVNSIETPEERQAFLLRNLFFENKTLHFFKIIEELYVSESTLLNDISEIKSILEPFKLTVKNTKYNGIYVLGEEKDKRHFIMEYFLIDRYQNNLKSFEQISSILGNIHLEEIFLIVLDEYRNAELELNDTIIFNTVIHIALALMRVKEGYQIYSDTSDELLSTSKEVQTAKKIIYRLEKKTDISLPDEEIYNIALHLRNKQSLENILLSENIKKSELQAQIIDGLNNLEKETGYCYSKDKILIDGLMAHFIPLILRIKNKNTIQNPFLKEIKQNYYTLFNKIKKSLSQVKIIENDSISDDEWAYISLHIIAAHERKINKEKKRVLVICATGLGSSQMIGSRLNNELGSKIIIEDIISYYEITEEKLKDIDLIISSIDLSNTIFNVPIVNVSVLLGEEDIKAINRVISPNIIMENTENIKNKNKIKDNNKYEENKTSSIEEIIDEYFDPNLFIYSKNILEKDEAINKLIDKSIEYDNSIDKVFLKNQLILRESFSSVVFAENIAIPHPIEGVANQSKVAVLITPQGIYWDKNNLKIKITLLLLPDRFASQHMEVVSKSLLPILESQDSISTLVKSKTYNEFKNYLIKILN